MSLHIFVIKFKHVWSGLDTKYKLYLPTEEELVRELTHERELIEQEKRISSK